MQSNREDGQKVVDEVLELIPNAEEFVVIIMTPEKRKCLAVIKSLSSFVDVAEEMVKCYNHFEELVGRNETDRP